MSPHALARRTGLCLAAMLAALPAAAQESKKAAPPEWIEGRVVAVERDGDGDGDAGRLCVTINTGVPWRDYARDTAARSEQSVEKAAEKGDDSISKGQPDDKQAMVKVYVSGQTTLRQRFRAQLDEKSLGAESAEAAGKLAQSEEQAGPEPGSKAGKAVERDQLKRGLFVIVGCTKQGDEERADWLLVMEPVRQDLP